MNKNLRYLVNAAVIAALYVVLTLLANTLGLANGAIQLRFSEALTILPLFTAAAIPGLFIGCILANFLSGAMLLDVLFGSLATLLGAVGTYYIGKAARQAGSKFIGIAATLPPIIANTLIVPFVIAYVYHAEGTIPYFMLTVGIGEVLSCGLLGFMLFSILKKHQKHIFID